MDCFDKCGDHVADFTFPYIYCFCASPIATLTLYEYKPLEIKHRKASKNKLSKINYCATKYCKLRWNKTGTLQTIKGEDSRLKREDGDFVAATGGRSCAALRKFRAIYAHKWLQCSLQIRGLR